MTFGSRRFEREVVRRSQEPWLLQQKLKGARMESLQRWTSRSGTPASSASVWTRPLAVACISCLLISGSSSASRAGSRPWPTQQIEFDDPGHHRP